MVIVGGGYTGMWAAWHVLEADPDARVVVLEAGRCGHGPSGRNGGFVSGMALSRAALTARFGAAAAQAWIDAAADTVRAIGDWCEAEGVDAWYRSGGELLVSTAPAQDAPARPRSTATRCVALDGRGGARAHRLARRARRRATCARAPTSTPPGWRSGCARGCCGARRAHLRGLPRAARCAARRAAWSRRPRAAACAPAGRARGGQRGERRAAAAARPADGLLQPHRLHGARSRRDRGARLDGRRVGERRARAAALHAHHARRADRVRLGRRADGRGRAHRRARWRSTTGVVAAARRDLLRFFPHARGARDRARLGRPDRRLPHPPARRDEPARACPPGPRSATRATASARRICWAGRWPRSRSTAATTSRGCRSSTDRRRACRPSRSGWSGAAAIRRALVRAEAAEEAGPAAGSRHPRRSPGCRRGWGSTSCAEPHAGPAGVAKCGRR